MNEATQITMPYTIAVYMVRDYLGPEASQAQISRLTGILVRLLAGTACPDSQLTLRQTCDFVLHRQLASVRLSSYRQFRWGTSVTLMVERYSRSRKEQRT